MPDESTFEQARAQFPVLDRYAYFQAGSVGPLSRFTLDAMHEEETLAATEGRGSISRFERILAARGELRAEIAELVGSDAAHVALTASTTDGCNIVLAGFGLTPADEVITTTDEHFGLIGPLHTSGARVVVVQPSAEAIVAAVTPRTRLIAISHVLWTTGQVLPVRELREETGLPILVDGAQSVGCDGGRASRGSTSTPSPVRSGCAGLKERARSSSRIPSRSEWHGRATSRSRVTSPTAPSFLVTEPLGSTPT